MKTQTCHVCGRTIKSNGKLPMIQHSKTHRKEFKEEFDREPEDYQEVKDKLGRCNCPKCNDNENENQVNSLTRAKDMLKNLKDYE